MSRGEGDRSKSRSGERDERGDRVEVYGTSSCPYTADLLEDLEWQERSFAYYDVERDAEAYARMSELTRGGRTVPVLVVGGQVEEIGFRGRGCYLGSGTPSDPPTST